jgi:integrase
MNNGPNRIRVGDRVSMTPRGQKGIWVAEFCQHCRRSLKTANKKVATERALELAVGLTTGTYRTAPSPVTVRQAADDYLAYLETEGRAPKTLVKYTGAFAGFVDFLAEQGVARLEQLIAAHFDRFRAERIRAGRQVKTLYTEGVIVKQLFRWAKTRRLISENPLADIKLSKPRLEPRGGPAFADVDRILAALSEPDRAMVSALAFAGMRSGELQRLTPDDIDLNGNWIHIVSRVGAETKTRTSRKVPIHLRLRVLLSCDRRRAHRWFFVHSATTTAAGSDRPVNVKKLNERFLATLERLGLPAERDGGGHTLHSLRHFFETFTVNNRIPQRVVDAWLGHSSDKSMAANYYKLADEESQRFMEEVPFRTGMPAADAGERN